MYYVGVSGIVGYDSVVRQEDTTYKPGDLIGDTQGIFLCIGKEVIFPDLYIKQRNNPYRFLSPTLITKQIISPKTIELIHRLVGHYFSSYKHVIGLFLTDTIGNTKDKPYKGSLEQSCIIYPDVRSLTQQNPAQSLSESTAILHGGMTKTQRNKLFRGIKNGSIKTLLATNRGLFYDWYNLTSIIVHNPSNWAYSNLSDPRFVIQEVVEKMGELYEATIKYI